MSVITILGPTASGKTSLAVAVAKRVGGEILSADSRQVYRRMDIGTGKDLTEYDGVPYHLIDICEPGTKYNLFQYQQDFAKAYDDICRRGRQPIICGGTGLYIEAVLKGYNLSPVPQNPELRARLEGKSLEELTVMLRELKRRNGTVMHNTTDVDTAQRAIRAIEIELGQTPPPAPPLEGRGVYTSSTENTLSEKYTSSTENTLSEKYTSSTENTLSEKYTSSTDNTDSKGNYSPPLAGEGLGVGSESLIIGVKIDRELRREKITQRLKARLDEGMADEVRRLLDEGIAAEDLIYYGLEYKYVTEYVLGRLSYDEMFRRLEIAIHQFAKRQMTWFRGMERRGFTIHWIDATLPMEEKVAAITMNYAL